MSRSRITTGSPHDDFRSLNQSKWTYHYHVVFIPRYRKKVIYGELRQHLEEVLRRLAQQRESESSTSERHDVWVAWRSSGWRCAGPSVR